MTLLAFLFWLSGALIVWTQVGYRLALSLVARLRGIGPGPAPAVPATGSELPALSLIVAAHDEQEVIAAKVANALALDYPRELLELIVACDGCTDETAERARGPAPTWCSSSPAAARSAPRTRPSRTPGARSSPSPTRTRSWEPDAARELVGAFADDEVGYACGQVRVHGRRTGPPTRRACTGATRWPLRALESRLSSITAGNGAIYATRRDSYIVVDPIMGHDLSLPFNIVKRGAARRLRPQRPGQREDGSLARGRVRAQAPDDEPHVADPAARRDALAARLSPGVRADDPLPPAAALRSPVLHVTALVCNVGAGRAGGGGALHGHARAAAGAARGRRAGGGAAAGGRFLIARYYVLTTASCAAGLWDWLRHGTSAAWEAAEGTR